VPPVAVAVKVTAVATVPVVGPETEAASVSGLMTIVADATAVFVLALVTVTETV
jgi:hypothetical protein